YAFTNADCIKLYKNDEYITTFDCRKTGTKKSKFSGLLHPPVLIDDMIGEQLQKEGYSKSQANAIKKLLIAFSQAGFAGLTWKHKLLALKLMAMDHLRMKDAIDLYSKYVGNWGQAQCRYRFEAIKEDKVVKVVERGPIISKKLWVQADHVDLCEDTTYDVATVQIRMLGNADQLLRYEQSTVKLEVSGDIELIGPDTISLPGGMSGTYVKTKKDAGEGILKVTSQGVEPVVIHFRIQKKTDR
ncbi:MAG: hypothetical protein PUC65_16240, partial [Clostridiales bacterium]|nr:hypothetical protein [Clostridiales bacterium]